MEIHNCSICLDDILQSTGSATLSCGHQFHIGCLGRWLVKNESCPYCRHEANDKEKIAEDQEDDDIEYDSEYEDDDEEEDDYPHYTSIWRWSGPGNMMTLEILKPIPEYNEEEHALWVFRSFFQQLEETESLPKPTSEKVDQHIPYIDLLMRHENTFDAGADRGYDSA